MRCGTAWSSRCRSRILTALGALLVAGVQARAQGGLSTEGGLFLLLPIGARAVGMGQAAAATATGSEAVWWNPAGLVAESRREAAIHHSQSILGSGDALSIVMPSQLLGTLALSLDVLNYGDFPLTDSINPDVPLGNIIPRNVIYGVSYASGIGKRLGVGLTYKVVQLRFDCSGPCPPSASYTATTSALDFGFRAELPMRRPTVVGLALRNVGLPFQVNDSQQADPLPTRIQLGIAHTIPVRTTPTKAGAVTALVAADVLETLELETPSVRVGTDIAYEQRLFLRGGYVIENGDGGGPSIGFGIVARNFVLDFGRIVGGLSADQGQSPTHLSLRFLF